MRLVLHPEVEADIIEAADWYEARAEGLGADLVAAVDAGLSAVVAQPVAWPAWPGVRPTEPLVRRHIVPRFQYYAIAYQRFDQYVYVLAVVHTRRKPFYWMARREK